MVDTQIAIRVFRHKGASSALILTDINNQMIFIFNADVATKFVYLYHNAAEIYSYYYVVQYKYIISEQIFHSIDQ